MSKYFGDSEEEILSFDRKKSPTDIYIYNCYVI